MQPLKPYYIAGSSAGLIEDKKPFLFPDQAYQKLENAYVWRERVKKREGLQFLGRLRRVLTNQAMGTISAGGAGTFTFNIFTGLGLLVTEPNAQIELGSLTNITITIAAPISQTLTDTTGTGILTIAPAGVITAASINYATGVLTLTFSGGVGASNATFSGAYYPSLPVMGIDTWEQSNTNQEIAIIFDTKYAYKWNDVSAFIELPSTAATTWTGSDSDFFCSTNYQGSDSSFRLFFTTNFSKATGDPIRYYNGSTWTDFAPLITATSTLYQAKILIPYYGRLLALNTWEGTTAGGIGGSSNFFARCRFSQIGNPIETVVPSPVVDLAWRSDKFGRGGFIDAPTDEAIISATYYKNTLIVGFERSIWQLRYVGEYGLPFLWERISSDFGTESQFSAVLFDQGVLSVGDRAIVSATSNSVSRIDAQIPDIVFDFQNKNQGTQRVQGIRDFQRELVFWSYADSEITDETVDPKFPNSVLVYNYRNNTYAIFRDNVTAFGYFQSASTGVTWGRTDIFWNDGNVFWKDVDNQQQFEFIACGNQQGFISLYGYAAPDEKSLSISAITFSNVSGVPSTLTVINHNVPTDGSIVFLEGALFTPTDPGINDQIYRVVPTDANTLLLYLWNGSNYGEYLNSSASTYIGNGTLAIFPKLDVVSKDFNPYQNQGKQLKLAYIDFLTDCTPASAMSVNILLDTSEQSGNILVGNKEVESSPTSFGYITAATKANPCQITSPNHSLQTGTDITITQVLGMTQLNNINYTITVVDDNNFTLDGEDSSAFGTYVSGGKWTVQSQQFFNKQSNYQWHRFYATAFGQYLTVEMTYDDVLMNDINTHQQQWILNALALWLREGGKIVF